MLATACGEGKVSPQSAGSGSDNASTLKVNTTVKQDRITASKVDSIASQVPASIRSRGNLIVGTTVYAPPLGFVADDNKTPIGIELDLASAISDVLGLKFQPDVQSWENLFLSVKSGKDDVGIKDITVTEERKELYDFATYRVDELAFEVKKDSNISSITKPADVAGLTVSVESGTNQEKVLLEWAAANKKAGLKGTKTVYYKNSSDFELSLQSGKTDAYFGPNPTLAYYSATTGKTKLVGAMSGGGSVPGRIGAMTKKDSGLVKAVAAAIDSLIKTGEYAKVLKRWGLEGEAITKSEINPPGLPKTSS
jgi:polar amino acid transport system substrate-binding protein